LRELAYKSLLIRVLRKILLKIMIENYLEIPKVFLFLSFKDARFLKSSLLFNLNLKTYEQ